MADSESQPHFVKAVSLYTERPWLLRVYGAPMGIVYAVAVAVAFQLAGSQDGAEETTTWTMSFSKDVEELAMIFVGVTALVHLLTFLTCFWSVKARALFTCSAATVDSATLALVVPTEHSGKPALVPLSRDETGMLSFVFQKIKFCRTTGDVFSPPSFPLDKPIQFYRASRGLANDVLAAQARQLFGDNVFDIPMPTFRELFIEQATAPFFVFQVLSVGLFLLDEYWYFSLFTLMMLIMFEGTVVMQRQRNLKEFRQMRQKPFAVQVYSAGVWHTRQTTDLLPGDLVYVVRGTGVEGEEARSLPCDLLLLGGTCVVNESMLTGESVPQMKEALTGSSDDEPLDVNGAHRVSVMFGGTTVVQCAPPSAEELKTFGLKLPGNQGCLCYVLRTGFHTSQGSLMRTILFSTERVTANNWETFGFIMFLLVFAVSASYYVWTHGTTANRTRYKLLVQCLLIITSVVPPELPMELSLAVNTSLLELSKLYIFCTEPFRIPFGGKIDVCCFDKTGTLTTNEFVVDGIAGLSADHAALTSLSALDASVQTILAGCQSLMKLDETLIGDPLEKATVLALGWSVQDNNVKPLTSIRGSSKGISIIHRHHFTSALKRMSVIVTPFGNPHELSVCVKGAPEVLRTRFANLPSHYEESHRYWERRGARVLALGHRRLLGISALQVAGLTRDEVEKDLVFGGFLVVSCPLKPDSALSLKAIRHAGHHMVMITGDSPLTACHVAQEVHITTRSSVLLIEQTKGEWKWESVMGGASVSFDPSPAALRSLSSKFDFCLTGDALAYITSLRLQASVIPHVRVFARVNPNQKQQVITTLKALGYGTLMCGDGTNDVGALKQADVGVALLDGTEASLKSEAEQRRAAMKRAYEQRKQALQLELQAARATGDRQRLLKKQAQDEIAASLASAEDVPLVKFGDASIASPFTSKLSSPRAVAHIIRQGRCTLVTTVQMFRILALNSLITAYTLSVLYLDGIRLGDVQATIQGLLLAGCFLFISRSKPLEKLSKQRPDGSIFSVCMFSTILCQFAIHLFALISVMNEAKRLSAPDEPVAIVETTVNVGEEVKEEFKVSLLNTSVYLISMWMQVCNFGINYEGYPFKESIRQNKGLFYSLLISGGIVLLAAFGFADEFLESIEVVPLSEEFRYFLLQIMAIDFLGAFTVDRILKKLFSRTQVKSL